jgi:hypothetical protein
MLKERALKEIDDLIALGYEKGSGWDLTTLRDAFRRHPYDEVKGMLQEEIFRVRGEVSRLNSVSFSFDVALTGKELEEYVMGALAFLNVGLVTGVQFEWFDVNKKLLSRDLACTVTPHTITAAGVVEDLEVMRKHSFPKGHITKTITVTLFRPIQRTGVLMTTRYVRPGVYL